jgi:hypothetical protein
MYIEDVTPTPPLPKKIADKEGGPADECRGFFAGSFPGTVLAMVVFLLVVYSLRRKQKSNMFVQYETKQKKGKKVSRKGFSKTVPHLDL